MVYKGSGQVFCSQSSVLRVPFLRVPFSEFRSQSSVLRVPFSEFRQCSYHPSLPSDLEVEYYKPLRTTYFTHSFLISLVCPNVAHSVVQPSRDVRE